MKKQTLAARIMAFIIPAGMKFIDNEQGSLNLWGPRYPVLSPEGDGGAAGGGTGEGGAAGAGAAGGEGDKGGAGSGAPDVNAQLAKMQEQLLGLTQQNAQLRTQVETANHKSVDDIIKNETDPAKLVKLLKGSLESQQEANAKLKKSITSTNIRSTLQRIAGEQVHDVADIMNAPEFREILKAGLDMDKMDLDETVATAAVQKLLEKKPYLKKQTVVPGTVNNKPGQTIKGKAVSEMSAKEIEAELAKVWNS